MDLCPTVGHGGEIGQKNRDENVPSGQILISPPPSKKSAWKIWGFNKCVNLTRSKSPREEFAEKFASNSPKIRQTKVKIQPKSALQNLETTKFPISGVSKLCLPEMHLYQVNGITIKGKRQLTEMLRVGCFWRIATQRPNDQKIHPRSIAWRNHSAHPTREKGGRTCALVTHCNAPRDSVAATLPCS